MTANFAAGFLDAIPTDISLPQQIDRFMAMGGKVVPERVVKDGLRPVQQLIEAGAAEKVLKAGEQVPDFTLKDALGQPVTLSQLFSQGPVVIIFYRGGWCPYCNLELRAYQKALPQLDELGAQLVAISPQTPDHSLSTKEKQGLTFKVLSDLGNQVARQFGLVFSLEPEVRDTHIMMGADLPAVNGDDSWELPMTGTFVIDQAGMVRLASVDPDFTHRLDPSVVIARLKELK